MRAGAHIARLLSGAWRASPEPIEMAAEDLERIAPLLHRSATAGLGWRRVRGSALEGTPTAMGLQQAYRLGLLKAEIDRQHVATAFQRFRAAGVEPVLGKGWAIARLYPEELRAYTDVDLSVEAAQASAAEELLPELAHAGCLVDLHRGFPQLSDRPAEAIHERSLLVPLSGIEVRVLGPEDHLRLLALHLLGHGAWRPLWLCDLAVALESRPPGFDWSWFQHGDARRTDWILCALRLAETLLGAPLQDAPLPPKRLPRWLVPAVLEQWGSIDAHTPQGARRPMSSYLASPSGWMGALRLRWPNPIEASVDVHAPFNDLPRWPFQAGACVYRTLRFAAALPAVLGGRR
jgi:hypothetical protein